MEKIGIITDSTAYLDEDYARDNDIRVVPLKVIFETDDFREGLDITYDEFFRRLKESPLLPTTSSPSLGEFKTAYEEMARGYDALISLHIASGISGTVEVARSAARQMPDRRIEVVDSHFVSLAIGIMIDLTLKGIREGRTPGGPACEVGQDGREASRYSSSSTPWNTSARAGASGEPRPSWEACSTSSPSSPSNGTIDALERVRGTRKAMARVLEIAVDDLKGRKAIAGVSHIHNPEAGMRFRETAAEALRCQPDELYFNETGPVIGAHTGPGLLAFGYLPEDVLR